jgi:hypothetical protein
MRTRSWNKNSRIRELSVVELAPHSAKKDVFIRPDALRIAETLPDCSTVTTEPGAPYSSVSSKGRGTRLAKVLGLGPPALSF